jgi:O-acetylserine/cysteine efflux transporter
VARGARAEPGQRLGQVTFTWAHYRIDPGVLTFGLRTQIVFAAVGAYLLFPAERPVIRSLAYLGGILAVGVGTSGAVLLGEEPLGAARVSGIVLSIASGLFFAGYGLSVRKFLGGVRSILAFAAISQITAAAMVTLMLLFGERSGAVVLDLPADQILLLLLSAVIGIAIGHVLYYASLARLGVAVTASVLQLQPFLVAVGSAMLFGERLVAAQWTGGGIAVAGAVLILTAQRRLAARRKKGRPSGESRP